MLKAYKTLFLCHYSFTKYRLCLTYLVTFDNGVKHQWQKEKQRYLGNAVYLDFCIAFDKVPYYILETYGIVWLDYLVDNELFGSPQPESSGQWFYVQMKAGDEWCLPGFCLGTGAL